MNMMEPIMQAYTERARSPASGDTNELAVIEGQMSWLVHIIAAILKVKQAIGGSMDSQELIDAELAARVLQLINVTDQGLHTLGEKLLVSLGGIFSKKWKPKKNREIKGPALTKDDSFIRRGSHMEQRQKLGLSTPLPRTEPRRFNSEPTSALEKVEMEKVKQDDALNDLSNLLGELKSMAQDMGSEIDRQLKLDLEASLFNVNHVLSCLK